MASSTRRGSRLAVIGKSLVVGLALAWAGSATADTDVPPPDEGMGWERFSVLYSPEVELSDTSLGPALQSALRGNGVQNFGLESSMQTGWLARYHAQLDYTYGYGFSGVRFEPLGFGWAFPIVRNREMRLEIEPLFSAADFLFLFSKDAANNANVTFLLSTGVEVQLNLTVGPFYVYASPLGLELRYLEVTTGSLGAITTGMDPFFRFRLGVGIQY